MIQLKTDAEVAAMRLAGLVVAEALEAVRAAVAPGVTLLELDAVAEREIRSRGAVPSFLHYLPGVGYVSPGAGRNSFPATICASVNDEIVHGIPSERRLVEGDIISVDCGAILDGWHGDAAVTLPVGPVSDEAARLLEVCEDALWAGIAALQAGHRLRDVGGAVEDHVRGQGDYGIVAEYGGHGIGTEMHQDPHVLNYRTRARGPRLVPGLVLAIEPMINVGGPETVLQDDEWTVSTADGSLSAHFEHSVAVTENGPWVLTAFDGGASQLTSLGVPTQATA
ncbi:MAG TPA: type I methionyl aminopeptidase [Jiangellaceae bacterium]|jgi:methionyl aminopeptidase|nr:type I methionyl aminopeptidase [Jiangellaceae bacterium]